MIYSYRLTALSLISLITASALLYVNFLWSPLFFDDIPFFTASDHTDLKNISHLFTRRWLSYASFAWTINFFGDNVFWLRLSNLALHAATTIVLFLFLRNLFTHALTRDKQYTSLQLSPHWLAFFGALIFSLHPISVYAVGYLIQRSILMATFFSLATWLLFLNGMIREKRIWLYASAITYLLAVFSKEHAIMAPAVAILLLPLIKQKSISGWLKLIWPAVVLYLMIALFAIIKTQSDLIIGQPYEIKALNLITSTHINPNLAYPISILTQALLFFKYLVLWVIPNPSAMSVDIRQSFPQSLWSLPQLFGLVLFAIYPIIAIYLLLKKGAKGLLGFAMLCPWLLFLPEISTTRIQEPFVLYRSYLWMTGIFAAIPFICQKLSTKKAVGMLILVSLFMYPISLLKLQTFSHPLLLWDDAARLASKNLTYPGTARIFYNRGNQYKNLNMLTEAIDDYNKVIEIADVSSYILGPTYTNRGVALLENNQTQDALESFNKAIAIDSQNSQAQLGKSLALKLIEAH